MLNALRPLLAGALLAVAAPSPAATMRWQFTPTGWNPAEWIMVKSPRWSYFGAWVQQPDHIQNAVPEGSKPEEWQGKRATETYTSMVWQHRLVGDAKLTTTLSFTPRMAPLIVLAPELGRDAQGRAEYREHFEICVFDQGVNLWHHQFADGKPTYKLAAFARFALLADTKYLLEVRLKGPQMTVRIDGHEFGYREEALPKQYYAGITGCEGLNRFYDFAVDGTWE